MLRVRNVLAVGLIVACFAADSQAVVVTFTGGIVTRLDTTTQTTSNTVVWDNVDYYEEGGFRLDFTPNSGSAGFATHVGNYYVPSFNDVIHSHWSTGNFGQVQTVEITKIGGGTFNLNYFILTSNTEHGGTTASGNELAFVEGFDAFNISTGPALQLPSENWGFPATQIFLGNQFDGVTSVRFYVQNAVDCFGMDEFYLDQEFTSTVPEASSVVAWSIVGAIGLAVGWFRKWSVATG
jgi:hypothetical protein